MHLKDLRQAYDFSIKGIVAKITLAMSTLSVVRFIVDIHSLPVTALLKNILKTYQVVFHTCFDIIFIWLPFEFPSWGKDVFIFYSLFAFIFLRILMRQAQGNYRHPWIILHNFKNSKARFFVLTGWAMLKAVLLWPLKIPSLASKPYLVVAGGGHGPSELYFSNKRPIEGVWQGQYFGDARLMMLVRLAGTLIAALIVLLWNYAYSI